LTGIIEVVLGVEAVAALTFTIGITVATGSVDKDRTRNLRSELLIEGAWMPSSNVAFFDKSVHVVTRFRRQWLNVQVIICLAGSPEGYVTNDLS
jgi:hypothetical protein